MAAPTQPMAEVFQRTLSNLNFYTTEITGKFTLQNTPNDEEH